VTPTGSVARADVISHPPLPRASARAIRRRARRKGERVIDFAGFRSVIFFLSIVIEMISFFLVSQFAFHYKRKRSIKVII
jgi:hypothetical protein